MFNLKEYIKADYERYNKNKLTAFRFIKAYFDKLGSNKTLSYIFTMRICTHLKKKHSKILLPFFKLRLKRLQNKFGIEISPDTKIGAGLRIFHGFGIVIHENAEIGKNFTILQNCTIGNGNRETSKIAGHIGDNVVLSAGSVVIGDVKIGNNSIIGANAVVTHDIPENSIAVGAPAKVIKTLNKN